MTITNEQIVLAIMLTLKERGQVNANDVVIFGQVLPKFNGYHIRPEQLQDALSDYVELGYFDITDAIIRITELGIVDLEINE